MNTLSIFLFGDIAHPYFLVMSPWLRDFLLTSWYIYSNKIIIVVGLTYEPLVFR